MVLVNTFSTLIKAILVAIFGVGLFFVFLIPPFQKPDEVTHFKKSVSIATGQFFCEKNGQKEVGVAIPKSLHNLPIRLFTDIVAFYPGAKIPKQRYKEVLLDTHYDSSPVFDGAACTLPFIFYVPSALAIALPIQLHLNPLLIFFAGRLATFLVSFAIFVLALKYIPKKLTLVLLLMFSLPTTLLLISSYSKDALHIALGALCFSVLLACRNEPKNISMKDLFLFFTSLTLVILSRPQYAPFLLLILLFPFQYIFNSSFGRKLKILFFSGIVCLIFTFFTFLLYRGTYMANQPSSTKISIQRYIYPSLQLSLMKENPLLFPSVLLRTYNDKLTFYVNSLIAIPGWSGEFEAKGIYFIYYLFFFYVLYKTSEGFEKTKVRETVVLLCIFLGTITTLSLAMFLYGTPVGSEGIENLNGRYFILLLPVFIWLIAGIRNNIKPKFFEYAAICFALFLIFISIYIRFYDTTSFYERGVDTEKITKKTHTIQVMSPNRHIQLQVNPTRKITGLRLFIENKKGFLKIYRLELRDSQCASILSSTVINSYILERNASNDILFHPVRTEQNKVCIVFRNLLPRDEGADLRIYSSLKTGKLAIYPLYLY